VTVPARLPRDGQGYVRFLQKECLDSKRRTGAAPITSLVTCQASGVRGRIGEMPGTAATVTEAEAQLCTGALPTHDLAVRPIESQTTADEPRLCPELERAKCWTGEKG